MERRNPHSARGNAPVLVFRSAGARLGVFIAEVGRVLVEKPLARVPFAHPALAGLLNDDDGIIPVFDLAALVADIRPRVYVEAARVAIFETERGPVGLRMDALEGSRADYTYVSDVETSREIIGRFPERLQRTVTGVGEEASGIFAFFSPDAFLAALDIGAASRPANPPR
jgi:chemotaxis signal transduction protein